MQDHKIEAHKITKPIQLTAVWFVALLLLDSAFLLAAAKTSQSSWLAPTLVISAIVFVPLFLVGVFLMQTVFRKELQEDQYYSEWLKRQERTLQGIQGGEHSVINECCCSQRRETCGRQRRRYREAPCPALPRPERLVPRSYVAPIYDTWASSGHCDVAASTWRVSPE